jgi:hypothetical protein
MKSKSLVRLCILSLMVACLLGWAAAQAPAVEPPKGCDCLNHCHSETCQDKCKHCECLGPGQWCKACTLPVGPGCPGCGGTYTCGCGGQECGKKCDPKCVKDDSKWNCGTWTCPVDGCAKKDTCVCAGTWCGSHDRPCSGTCTCGGDPCNCSKKCPAAGFICPPGYPGTTAKCYCRPQPDGTHTACDSCPPRCTKDDAKKCGGTPYKCTCNPAWPGGCLACSSWCSYGGRPCSDVCR